MLRATRRGFLKRGYDIRDDAGAAVELTGLRREGCEFSLDGERLRVERERRKRFLLTGPRGRVAVADRESGRRWGITTSAGTLTLEKPSMWRSAWELRQGGRSLGRIEPDGIFRRSSHADLPAEVPLPVRVFAFYVVLVLWERANAAAAAASG